MIIQALEKAEAIRLAELDQSFYDGRLEGRLEGRVEGRAEGRTEGQSLGRFERAAQTAQFMLEDGEPLAKIKRYTGLSESEILALQANPPN